MLRCESELFILIRSTAPQPFVQLKIHVGTGVKHLSSGVEPSYGSISRAEIERATPRRRHGGGSTNGADQAERADAAGVG